jgi:transcriptional regulator with XRE-family HTH domain
MSAKSHPKDYQRSVEQETLILDATELICSVMEEAGMSRQELAKRLGKSKGFVSQLLSGRRNMTLRTLGDVMYSLGHRFELSAAPLAAERRYPGAEGTAATRPSRAIEPVPMPKLAALSQTLDPASPFSRSYFGQLGQPRPALQQFGPKPLGRRCSHSAELKKVQRGVGRHAARYQRVPSG